MGGGDSHNRMSNQCSLDRPEVRYTKRIGKNIIDMQVVQTVTLYNRISNLLFQRSANLGGQHVLQLVIHPLHRPRRHFYEMHVLKLWRPPHLWSMRTHRQNQPTMLA